MASIESQSDSSRRRGSHIAICVIAVIATIVLYVGSYAPFVRFQGGDRPEVSWERISATERQPYMRIVDGRRYPAYRPVDWLIDRTPLQRPLLAWAELWAVDGMFLIAHANRIDADTTWKDSSER